MNQRDREDVMMQARETSRQIMSEVLNEINETELKRALGEVWSKLPPEAKAELAKEKPDVAKAMEQTNPQGNPWGKRKGR
jgi:hypothetical protein